MENEYGFLNYFNEFLTNQNKDTSFNHFKKWLEINKNKYIKFKKPRVKTIEDLLNGAYIGHF
jgi:hypothetical protein